MSTGPSERPAPSGLREVFAARLREALHTGGERRGGVSPTRRAYREAACLLARFDPRELRLPDEKHATGRAVLELVDDCTTLGMQDQAGWALKAEVREEALVGLAGPEAARRLLAANIGQLPAEPGPERFALAQLFGTPLAIDRLTAGELADALQAVLWLSRVPGMTGLPDTGRLQRALERARLLEPLERLVRRPFQGRAAELAELHAYVALPRAAAPPGPPAAPPGGGPGPVPAMVIHGPGGMGKSTLLAKFLLDSVHDPAGGIPFAYIDFERPTLSVHEPITLIAEAARQLGIQYPAHRAELDALAEECQQVARSQREGQERVTQLHELAATRAVLGRSYSQQFQSAAIGRETGLVRRVGEVLTRAVAEAKSRPDDPDPPFVVALDTFEEAQYRGSPALGRMVAVYMAFQSAYPRLRFVVSGRAPVEHPAKQVKSLDIELGELDPEAAVGLLASCGVDDPEVARELAARVGGHPLSLKLAARAATLAGLAGEPTGELIRSLPERRREVFRRVDQLLVQGILYDRILSHIADEDIRRLAHPGLVLRVITPEIIQDVLAGPCGLDVPGPERARELFDELSRLDMVEPAAPDAVRYRGDVRAIMLRLPGGDRTAVMREVERRAVAHYAARDGLEARAEEIYHRLRLDENPRSVEERWLPGVERFLAGAGQEMSPRAAGLLTARLGGGAPDHVAAGADQEDWERIAAREAEDLLAQGFATAALERIGRRRPWTPCSPLHALYAEALSRVGRRDEARRAVADALVPAGRAGCGERRLELLLLSARLAQEDGDPVHADRALRAAEDVAVGLGQDLEAMGALLARARLTADEGRAEPATGRQLAERLRKLPDDVLTEQPVLVRAVASQIYTQAPGALEHAVEVVGLPSDDETLDALGAAMRRATRRQPALLGKVMEILDEAAGPSRPEPGAAPTSIAGILRLARDRGTLDALARRLLAVPDRSGEIVAGVAAAMGVGSGARTTTGEHVRAAPAPEQRHARERRDDR
ncbi:ATP-binding protein [Streptomyces sp. NPDC048196]|uniref:ATP-binding protein n=1 Tax=Streptomyces sp. NPDC048196 TaxID=3154712 RepID=UPI0033CFE7CC